MKVDPRARGLWGLLAAAAAAALVASGVGLAGYPATADFPAHYHRLVQLQLLWEQGVIYSRWAPDLMLGLGYPLFEFVPPLPYYLALTLSWLPGVELLDALKTTVLLALLGLGAGTYRWLSRHLEEAAAALGAGAAVLSPFFLREVFVQGNVPQLAAFACLPWALAAVEETALGNRWASVRLGLAVGAALLSHLAIGAVTVASVSLLAGIRCLERRAQWRVMAAEAGSGLLLGLAVSAWFWLPAARGIERTWIGEPLTIRRHFAESFVDLAELWQPTRPWDPLAVNPLRPFNLGWAQLGLAAVATASAVRPGHRRGRRGAAPMLTGGLALMAVGILLANPASRVLWERVVLLHFFEFPSRWLGLASIGLAAMAAAGGESLSRLATRPSLRSLLLGVLAIGLAAPQLPWVYSAGDRFVPLSMGVEALRRYETESGALGTTSEGEYLPRWVTLPREDLAQAWHGELTGPGARPERLGYAGRTRLLERWQVTAPEEGWVTLPHLYDAGWTAREGTARVAISPAPGSGLTRAHLAAGEHLLLLEDGGPPGMSAARWASVLATLGLGGWLARRKVHPAAARASPGGALRAQPSAAPAAVPAALALLLLAKTAWMDTATTWFRYPQERMGQPAVDQRVGVHFGSSVELYGFNVEAEPLPPARPWARSVGRRSGEDILSRQGEALEVLLVWKLQGPVDVDYRTFVHLTPQEMPNAPAVVSDHRHPGILYPFSRWAAGRYVLDRHLLQIDAQLPTVPLVLRAGAYHPGTGERLRKETNRWGDFTDLADLAVVWILPHPLREPSVRIDPPVTFGEQIELRGFDLQVADSDAVRLTLYWRSARPPERDWSVFVHLLTAGGERLGQADGYPVQGRSPTGSWPVGLEVLDPRTVPLEARAPSGGYLLVGLYDLQSGDRLTAQQGGASLPESAFRIELSR